jgi:hypothetical protein
MYAEKSAGVRYGTEAFALGGFTETLGDPFDTPWGRKSPFWVA